MLDADFARLGRRATISLQSPEILCRCFGSRLPVESSRAEDYADSEKFPQEPLFQTGEEVYVEDSGRTKGPYDVVSVTRDCKYTLKLKADGSIRRGVLEQDLRELDT